MCLSSGNASRECYPNGTWADKTDYTECNEVGSDATTDMSIVIYAVGKESMLEIMLETFNYSF